MMDKPRVLLHSCCGPCSTACIERLIPDYHVIVLYYNPCINDKDEYELRKENQIKFIEAFNQSLEGDKVEYIDGRYDPEEYERLTVGLESEPEGGKRCSVCFEQRLRETARLSKEMSTDFFTTTLTVSPHKNYSVISAIAKEMAKEFDTEFLDIDFKKKAGFQRSTQLSKEYGLYRQNYCGCNYSK